MQIYGVVEILVSGDWLETINISSILLDHSDLNGCLFGVDNYAGYAPLFPDRRIPPDASDFVNSKLAFLDIDATESHATWVLFSELKRVDWDESAMGYDQRVTEYSCGDDEEVQITKWLEHSELDWVREKLERDPARPVKLHNRVFKRRILTRRDSLAETDFPLLMELMGSLAKRFSDDAVRLVVWFG